MAEVVDVASSKDQASAEVAAMVPQQIINKTPRKTETGLLQLFKHHDIIIEENTKVGNAPHEIQ
ncbi:unnamed protein product, partial [Amoebophrya sp. A120]|eukprot:GSA120T00020263001.1